MITRILKFLMIAAVAWPAWTTATAQEELRTKENKNVPNEELCEVVEDGAQVQNSMMRNNVLRLEAPASKAHVTKVPKDAKKQEVQAVNSGNTVDRTVKTGKPGRKAASMLKAIRPKTQVPDGYALIVLVANDVWGDGSGYQMLLDEDATMYSASSWQDRYSAADYTIPENADYSSTGDVTNMLIGQIGQVVVPAGTYDIYITNPTPGDRVYLASTNGNVGGSINDYTIEAGKLYTFTVSLGESYDQTDVEVSSLNDYLEQPSDLAANPATTSAFITWEAGHNNEGWNLRYRPYVDEVACNRSWTFPVENGTSVFTDGWILYDADGDGYTWGYAATNGDSNNGIPTTDACLYSQSWISGDYSQSGSAEVLTPNNWAISPEVTLGGTLKFKARTNGFDDKLGVFVHEGSLNTLSESSLVQVGSDFVPAAENTMTEYEFNLSGFSGTGYVIIRHYNCSDEYNVFVDDIELITPNNQEIPEWIYVNDATNPYNIVGLTTGTTYEVQVQGVGLDTTTDWTSSVLFTPHSFTERDIVVKDKDFFETEDMSYTWVDDDNVTHKSYLADPATDPNQMIAMIKKIYTDPRIPGNLKRGFDVSGNPESTNNNVYYTGVGGLKYTGTPSSSGSSDYLVADNYEFDDIYGWGITGSVGGTGSKFLNTSGGGQTMYYAYMNLNEYKPDDEGLTLLFVELKDTYVDGSNDAIEDDESYDGDEAGRLKAYFTNTIKSIRVVTESKRVGQGLDKGTLFKIDCNKMNKFFLLAKGGLRLDHVTGLYTNKISWITDGSADKDYCIPPNAAHFNRKDFFMDRNATPLFYHMFEQFSPTMFTDTVGANDLYQKMVTNMESFPVVHDCIGITYQNHQFLMYGPNSPDHDCQDIRDFIFIVPDYRMLDDGHRDPGAHLQQYLNYNTAHRPLAGVFTIKQYPITGEKLDNQDTYKLHLTWTSNLLNFLPGEDGKYTLYRVITNADGTKTYQKVGNFDPNTFEYNDSVPMQHNGQQVTYVVQGQDVDEFLTLQMSNEESFIIPGLDRAEQIRIALNSDYYFSRYDAADQTNNYSNSIIANNTVGTNVKPEYLQAGSEFKFWRATIDEQSGNVIVPTKPFVVAKVQNDYSQTDGGSLRYEQWDDQTNFSGKPYGHGYHANNDANTRISIVHDNAINQDVVVFDGLKLYDNFSVNVADNTHPTQYVYYVTLETAVSFPLNDAGTETSNQARSNTISVPVYKTGMAMNPLSKEDVDADTTHLTPAGTKFDLQARYSSRSEILGYYIYRWADNETAANDRSIYESNGDDSSPQGQAGNQVENYTVAMNTDYIAETANFTADALGNYPDVTASFVDNFMVKQAAADTYTYAPVVELFAPVQAVELPSGDDREDYNTYGGPQQMTAGGVIDVKVIDKKAWTKGDAGDAMETWTKNGKTYTYYRVILKVNNLDLPGGQGEYKLYKIRAWNKVDAADVDGTLIENYDNEIGEQLFVDSAECKSGELACIFPGRVLSNDDNIPMDFTVRIYFTKNDTSATPSGAPRLKEEGEAPRYYIAETTASDKITSDIPTGISTVYGKMEPVSVKYYNAAGVESDHPFKGVNIVVKQYENGNREVVKVIK